MFSYPFAPAMSGGVFRILRFAGYLPECGWEPIVITPRPESVVPITIDPSLERLVPGGLRIERTRVLRPIISAKSGLKRILRLSRPQESVADSCPENNGRRLAQDSDKDSPTTRRVSLADRLQRCERYFAVPDRHVGWFLPALCRGFQIVRRQRPHVIYSTGPPHSTHLIAVALKKLTGIPVVLDFRDPWADREWQKGTRQSFAGRCARFLERRCVHAADRVILNTPALCQHFELVYGSDCPGRFCSIPNGYHSDMVAQVEELVAQRRSSADANTIRLCHAGSAWGKRDLRPLAEAVAIAAESGCCVEMEQVGPVNPELLPRSNGANGSSQGVVRCLGAMPHQQALRRMAQADILVLIQPDNTLQVPGKVYEMMPFRKPILALTGCGATADLVRRYGLGEVVDPTKPAEIASAILRAARMPQAEVQDRFREALTAFDGRTLTRHLAEELDSVAKR